MNIENLKNRQETNIQEKLKVPEYIQELRGQSLSREEIIHHILGLLDAPKYHIGYQYLVKVISTQCNEISEFKTMYEQMEKELKVTATGIEMNVRDVIKNIRSKLYKQETLDEMNLKNLNSRMINKEFILITAEYVRFIEGSIPAKEMKIRKLLHLLQTPQGQKYEAFVKEIAMQCNAIKTGGEGQQKVKAIKSSDYQAFVRWIRRICDNQNNRKLLEEIGFRDFGKAYEKKIFIKFTRV